MIEWLNEGLTKGQFVLFVIGFFIGFVIVLFLSILKKASEK